LTKPQAIEKVRKLRRLAAQAGTREEASAAAGKAWELMREHQLSEDQIAPVQEKMKVVPIRRPGRQADHQPPASAPVSSPILYPDALVNLGLMAQELVNRLTVEALRRLGVPVGVPVEARRKRQGGRR
jgi:hypothetical protein